MIKQYLKKKYMILLNKSVEDPRLNFGRGTGGRENASYALPLDPPLKQIFFSLLKI